MEDTFEIGRTAVRGGFYLFIGMFSSTILLAFTTIIVARLLGPENYGLYTLIMVIPNFLITVSDVGLSPSLTRFSARLNTENKNSELVKLIYTGIITKIIITSIISIILITFAEQIGVIVINRSNIGNLIKITSIYMIGQTMLNTINSILIGLDEMGKTSFLRNIESISRSIFSPILIYIGLNITGALIGTGIGFLISSLIGIIFLSKRLIFLNKNINYNDFKKILKNILYFGMPLYFSSLFQNIEIQLRRLLMAYNISNIDIGNYSTAMNFSLLIGILLTPITSSIFPAFSKLKIEEERSKLQNIFKISIKYTSLMVIPVSIILSILSKNIVLILYGNAYKKASFYLSMYLLSYLSTGIGRFIIPAFLNGQGETKRTLEIDIINLFISFALSAYLISKIGIPGVFIAITISQIISNIYGLNIIHKKYGISMSYISSLKVIITSLLSGLITIIVQRLVFLNNLILNTMIIGIVYLIALFITTPLTGTINLNDLNNIQNLTKEIIVIKPIIGVMLKLQKEIINIRNKLKLFK